MNNITPKEHYNSLEIILLTIDGDDENDDNKCGNDDDDHDSDDNDVGR